MNRKSLIVACEPACQSFVGHELPTINRRSQRFAPHRIFLIFRSDRNFLILSRCRNALIVAVKTGFPKAIRTLKEAFNGLLPAATQAVTGSIPSGFPSKAPLSVQRLEKSTGFMRRIFLIFRSDRNFLILSRCRNLLIVTVKTGYPVAIRTLKEAFNGLVPAVTQAVTGSISSGLPGKTPLSVQRLEKSTGFMRRIFLIFCSDRNFLILSPCRNLLIVAVKTSYSEAFRTLNRLLPTFTQAVTGSIPSGFSGKTPLSVQRLEKSTGIIRRSFLIFRSDRNCLILCHCRNLLIVAVKTGYPLAIRTLKEAFNGLFPAVAKSVTGSIPSGFSGKTPLSVQRLEKSTGFLRRIFLILSHCRNPLIVALKTGYLTAFQVSKDCCSALFQRHANSATCLNGSAFIGKTTLTKERLIK